MLLLRPSVAASPEFGAGGRLPVLEARKKAGGPS